MNRKLGSLAVPLISFLLLLLILTGCAGQKGSGLSRPGYLGAAGRIGEVEYPAQLATRLEFRDYNGNNYLDAGEVDTLLVTITNLGRGRTFGLALKAELSPPLSQVTFQIPDLPDLNPGDSLMRPLLISAAKSLPDSAALTITANCLDLTGNSADFRPLRLETRAYQTANLVIADKGIDDDREGFSFGNNNHAIESKETVELTLLLQNRGAGPTGNVQARLVSTDPNVKVMDDSLRLIDQIDPGQSAKLNFIISVFPLYHGSDTLPLSLQWNNRSSDNKHIIPLSLMMNREEHSAEMVVIRGRDLSLKPAVLSSASLVPEVEINVPVTKQVNKNAIGVIIANRNYNYCEPVDYAENDGDWMQQYFEKAFGIPPENIIRRNNATRTEFERIFGPASGPERSELRRRLVDQQSDVYIYYSGHGFPDYSENRNEAYFVPYDGDVLDISLTGYPVQTLYNNLSRIPARSITVIVDACFCGESPRGPLMKAVSKVRLKVKNPILQLEDRSAVFTACGPDEVSNWYIEQRHGFFTYYFLKGLQGGADLDKNGLITAAEMKSFLDDPVSGVPRQSRIICGNEQHPQVFGNLNQELFKP